MLPLSITQLMNENGISKISKYVLTLLTLFSAFPHSRLSSISPASNNVQALFEMVSFSTKVMVYGIGFFLI